MTPQVSEVTRNRPQPVTMDPELVYEPVEFHGTIHEYEIDDETTP